MLESQMTAGKEILEACRIHTRETAFARSTGADVSPMTWDGAQYVFTITSPETESTAADSTPMTWDAGEAEDDDEDEPDDVSRQAEALQSINITDVLHEVSELLQDDDQGSPLVQQLEVWLSDPMTAIDPAHLAVTPMTAERVGRHVLSLAAAVLERQLQAAQGRLGDVAF